MPGTVRRVHLSERALNRTLLARQHLLARVDAEPLAMVEHLVGLQAQDNLPPYLSLAARLERFDPHALSALLERRDAVRFFTMRGTIHLLTPADALTLRRWVQPFLDRQRGSNQQARTAEHLTHDDVEQAVGALLAGGTAPVKAIKEHLAGSFPGTPGDAALHVARQLLPLVQAPPRGLWKRSGGVVYGDVEDWLDVRQTDVDLPALVRRWLTAYGPATPADMTTWSGVTRLGPVFKELDLTEHTGPDGKVLYDVDDAPMADEDAAAPARLLGVYDNVWLSHAARDRVLAGEKRKRWMGVNGGNGNLVLLDGRGEGQWRLEDGHVVLDLWRKATRSERAELAEESERVEALMAVPAYEGA